MRKLNRFSFLWHTTSRHHIYEEFTACRYMENGLILHLTKLDDNPQESAYSFRSALKELNKSKIDLTKREKLNSLLAKFRRDLHGLKSSHRNVRVAHLNKHEERKFDQFLNFETQINHLLQQANTIGDLIWGQKIEYKFKLGTHEGILDFRKLNEDLKVDPNSGSGW